MSERTVVVTGANGGLGLHVGMALAAAGDRVVLACRNQTTGAEARAQMAAVATGPEPMLVALDLADLASVRDAAAEIADRCTRVDTVVNNAGLMAIPRRTTADGFEMQLGTNHLGHFALTGHLLDALHRSPSPRVVSVASMAHWWGWMRWKDLHGEKRYERWSAYGQSKLANLLFTHGLHRRAERHGSPLLAVAAHPGLASTGLYDGPQEGFNPIAWLMGKVGHALGQPSEDGALPVLDAATLGGLDGDAYLGPRGPVPPLEIRGRPGPARRRRVARNDRVADRLWAVSEELTGVEFAWPAP